MKESTSYKIRVHKDFYKIVQDFINEFEKKNLIRISSSDATRILASKINKVGFKID